jgi:ubiquinone/menaquinone biosynthesis C-methylase UbiE
MPDASFDTVIASFVLEHLYDPFSVVDEVARVLRPGGEFLFCTITRDSIDARQWGPFWAGYDFPRHMVYFSNDDLRKMIERHFEWQADARHDAIQDFAREAWWRLMDHRNLTDRIVGRLVKVRAGRWMSAWLARAGLSCRISIRCRRR